LPHLDVAQNVGLPLLLLGKPDDARVQDMLNAVGLNTLGARLPQQLSGGQLQRVAIARALVHRPGLLLADEPTGNLDPTTAAMVMDALVTQTRLHNTTLVLVTHSSAATTRADRVLRLSTTGISSQGV
jgi:putative ABC transport system ATP-binding protein